MPCYHPLTAWRSRTVHNGSRGITFNVGNAFLDMPLTLPCGRCIGCRLERSRQWAMRCVHEAKLYERNAFITLTYSPEHLPENGSLVVRDFQLFMKRLRKHYEYPKVVDGKVKMMPKGIRFFACGEYGELLCRPHYHAILFNHDFDDKVYMSSRDGNKTYKSETLAKIWGKGFVTVGSVTFESAAYVARYCVKKINGPKAQEHYNGKVPEFALMSRKPGIGMRWLEKFGKEVYRDDEVIFRGMSLKPPKAYDKAYGRVGFIGPLTEAEYMRRCILMYVKSQRAAAVDEYDVERTPRRLAVREAVRINRAKSLSRELESEA